jgi:hypothetical protein
MKNRFLELSFLVLTFFTLLFQGCSTAKVRIMSGEDGVNQVVSRDIERDNAEEAAYDKARDYCEDKGKQMYVVKEEKTAYSGSMKEETRNTVRNASKAAMILGGPVGVLSQSAGAGGVVGGAGVVGYSMTSDRDYEARFSFRCK